MTASLTLVPGTITRRLRALGVDVWKTSGKPGAYARVHLPGDTTPEQVDTDLARVRAWGIQQGYDVAVDQVRKKVTLTLPEPSADDVVTVDEETGDTYDADGLQVGNLHDGETEPGAPLAPLAADGLPPIGDPRWIEAKERGIGMGALLAEQAARYATAAPAESHDTPAGPTRRERRRAARRDRTARRAQARGKRRPVIDPRRAIAAALTRDAVTVRLPELVTDCPTETSGCVGGPGCPDDQADPVAYRAHLADVINNSPDPVAVLDASHEAAELDAVTVKIENTYPCGRESESAHQVPAPPPNAGPWIPGQPFDVPTGRDVLDDWFEENVREHTGDGHPCGQSEDALYTATITAAPGRPELVGQTHEWGL